MTSVARCMLFLVCAAALAGCGPGPGRRSLEYTPDMAYSLPYDSFAPNPVTRDGLTLQRPVPGTIPRGFLPLHYSATSADAERAGRELDNPIPPTAESAAEGQLLFDTFCVACHGSRGDGDGPLIPRIPNPPAYTSERVRTMPIGRIFHVITFGSGRMPPYRSQVAPRERWLIAAHVQTLQTGGDRK